MLNFEKEILDSFNKLKKSPRGNQLQYIDEIVSAYLIDGFTNVVISAPTGSGKSIIGAIVADVIQTIVNPIGQLSSFILTKSNVLTDQYYETFKDIKDFVLVKGANNYDCFVLDETADSCCETIMLKSKEQDLMQMAEKYCSVCEYKKLKQLRHKVPNLITNYSYYFIDRLFIKRQERRTITVWDEAHTINDTFAEHCAVFVSEKRIKFFIDEIAEHLKLVDSGSNNIFKVLRQFQSDIKNGKINDSNYLEKLEYLAITYKDIELKAQEQAKEIIKTDLKTYSKLTKLSKRYSDLAGKIFDLLEYEYEHVFEYNKDTKEISVKPIFVNKMFNVLINSDLQLFMSATVSKTLLTETLGLNPEITKFIKIPSLFPIENKKVIFTNTEKLNYTTLKEKSVQDKIKKVCNKIVLNHLQQNESGIILTPSFDITEMIVDGLDKDIKIYQHQRGGKLAAVVEAFKRKDEPAILISPSMFEGVSLDGDLSRFQIFVKCPYPSLGEKRMKYIAEHHKSMYELTAILKIIQGAGRSVRGPEDHAVTYMIDSMLNWIWKSNLNVWKDEFSTGFSQF